MVCALNFKLIIARFVSTFSEIHSCSISCICTLYELVLRNIKRFSGCVRRFLEALLLFLLLHLAARYSERIILFAITSCLHVPVVYRL